MIDHRGDGERRPTATVSGSFRRHMQAVQAAVAELATLGVSVLSPADPRVVDAFGDFLFVASDKVRTVKVVQSRHLAAIERSDFLWLVIVDGYIGPSAAMEIGWAAARGIPVFTASPPDDLTFRQFVTVVPGPSHAVLRVANEPGKAIEATSLLLDPLPAVERGHALLDTTARSLLTASHQHRERDDVSSGAAASLRELLGGV